NVADAASVAGVAVDTRHWIGGQRVSSAVTFTDVSPIDEQPLAEVAAGGPAEVDAAVRAAAAAFPGWAATSPAERAALLHAIADGIERRAEELGQVGTAGNGAPLPPHPRGGGARAARGLRFFARSAGARRASAARV